MKPVIVIAVCLLAILGWFVTAQLKTQSITISPPTFSAAQHPPVAAQQPSTIAIEISTSLDNIQATGQQLIPERFEGLVENPSELLTEDTINWTVWLGQLNVGQSQGKLTFDVPVTGRATLRGRVGAEKKNKGLLGLLEEIAGFSFSETTTIKGSIQGSVLPTITPDWTVAANLTATLSISKAEADLFGKAIKVSFRNEVQKVVDKELERSLKKLNSSLAKNTGLRTEIERIWTSMHLIETLSDTPPIQFTLVPRSLSSSKPAVSNTKLSIVVRADVNASLMLQEHADAVVFTPLPNHSITEAASGISLFVPVAIKLSQFDSVPTSQLGISSNVDIPGGTLSINSISVKGDNKKLFLAADVVIKGRLFNTIHTTIYLTGQPVIDVNQQLVHFEQLEFDIGTQTVLADVAQFLLKPITLSELEKRAVFSLKDERHAIIQRANTELKKIAASLPAGLSTTLIIDDGLVSNLYVDDGWLVAFIQANGNATLNLENSTLFTD